MWLVVRSGERSGQSFEIPEEGLVLGRGEEADITLADARASRKHACIRSKPEGGGVIEDLGSGNGTFVNGSRIDKPVHLSGDEQVQIGSTVFGTSRYAAVADAGSPTVVGTSLDHTQSGLHRLRVKHAVNRIALMAVAALAVTAGVGAFVLSRNDGSNAVAKTVERVAPSTVVVQSLHGDRVVESGSGWVLDAKQGLVVTNAHVINGGERFQVGNRTGLRDAEAVGVAPCEDLAVLRVSGLSGLRTLRLGTQSSLRQGQNVVAIGFPANASREAELTATEGVVSVTRSAYREPAIDVPEYVNVVQTDAAINPGSSGGPLVDLRGRLVGVNSAGRTIAPDGRVIQGQGYAIGVDRVKEIVAELRAGRSRGWTGSGFRWPTRADLARPGFSRGLRTSAAARGTAAVNSPLGRPGTRILRINGQPAGTTLVGYCDAVASIDSGDEATFEAIPPGTTNAKRFRVRFE